MTSLREYPARRQPPSRPQWVLPAIIVGVVALAVVVVILVVKMVGGSGDAASEATATPSSSCSTVMAVLGDELPLPGKVRVNVYNASDVSGLASKTAKELTRRGFVIKEVANDPEGVAIEGVAVIRYGPESLKRAELLAAYVPGAELVEVQRSGPKIDLAMGTAFAGIAPQAEVDAALNAATPKLVGPGCASTEEPSASASAEVSLQGSVAPADPAE